MIRQFDLSPSFFCSFHISNLFTNVFLEETINICADAFYVNDLAASSFPRDVFIQIMQRVTKFVKSSFSNLMYRQIDGVAIGSPLDPALANIFVGHYKS